MTRDEIAAGVRTVVTIDRHFDELKGQARVLLEAYSASRRGYFTPSEDEQVRHLLVSYWQSRNALIELVVTHHDTRGKSDDSDPAVFLVAYAGALVLVDAARFLRENIHELPVVRQKLNEPEPHFDIPAGTYDRIQKSLTSPVHAWHLFHACRYYEKHHDDLAGLAAAHSVLAPLLVIIERLEARAHVSLSEYATSRLDVRAREAATAVKRDLLSRALYGLQRAVSRLVSDVYTHPQHEPELPTQVAGQLRGILRPGDVLITRKDFALTNYFLPGYWPHAALYIGTPGQLEDLGLRQHENLRPRWQRLLECDSEQPHRVLESMKDGVWIRSLASPFHSDALAVLRPRLSASEVAEAIGRGMFHESKPYDFDFDFTRSDRLVCTEVVYRSYEQVGAVSFELTSRAGRMTLAAEDLLRMALQGRHFDPVAVYTPDYGDQLSLGAVAETTIRASLGE